MKKLNIALLIGLLGLAPLSASAYTTFNYPYLSDYQYPFEYLNGSDNYSGNDWASVTHDLSSYIPDPYTAVSGTLILAFADDSKHDSKEYAKIYVDFSFLDKHEVDGTIWSYDWEDYDLSASTLANINDDGKLVVSVKAKTGDFWWKKSWLKLKVEESSVPEPSALLMLGSGLLLAGFASRRRRRSKEHEIA